MPRRKAVQGEMPDLPPGGYSVEEWFDEGEPSDLGQGLTSRK